MSTIATSESLVWNIRLLGGLQAVTRDGRTVVTRFRSQRCAALLAYLALHPGRLHSREELADMLWPDADLEAGRTNLRTALASLRRQLEGPGIAAEGDVLRSAGRTHVQIAPETAATDVARFEAALARAGRSLRAGDPLAQRHLAEAVAAYGGPLLPGLYDDWAVAARERLAEEYLRALLDLAEMRERSGDGQAAAELYLQAVAADPLREEPRLRLIHHFRRAGEDGAARRQYREIEKLLEDRLGAEPSRELRAALEGPLPALLPALPAVATLAASEAPASVSAGAAPAPRAVAPALPTAMRLPAILSRFFGRESEKAALTERLTAPDGAAVRMITLTGPGGSGKTRLAIETARALGSHFTGGVYFVPLADLREAGRIHEAIAVAIGVDVSSAASPLDGVAAALCGGGGPALLLLDNLEQLLASADAPGGAAAAIRSLLERVPCVSIVATSRQRIGVEGECELPVGTLPVPCLPGTPQRLLEFASIQLFVNRAQAARADFPFNERNAGAVADLCARLDGIPLAIELAAGWAQTLTPAQILQRLEEGQRPMDLLVTRRRDAPARHATLRAAMAWSYDLLGEDVRRTFRLLSVFRGAWTLEAAEAVTGDPRAVERLAELRERSLLLTEEQGGGDDAMRYRMLVSLREFADELLMGEERAGAERRHADFYAALAQKAEPHLIGGSEQTAWLNRLEADQENLRAVLERSLGGGGGTVPPETGLRLAGWSARFWQLRCSVREGADLFFRLLALPANGAPDAARGRALRGLGVFAQLLGDYAQARRYHEEALAIWRRLGDELAAARVCLCLGNISFYQGDLNAARREYDCALAVARRLGSEDTIARLLVNLGMVSQHQGSIDASLESFTEALALFRRLGDDEGTAKALMNLALASFDAGDVVRAQECLDRCRTHSRDCGDLRSCARATHDLACVLGELGERDRALALCEESGRFWKEMGEKRGLSASWALRGRLALDHGDLVDAHEWLVRGLEMRRETGSGHDVAESLMEIACLDSMAEPGERTARLLGASDALLESLCATLRPHLRRRRDRAEGRARAALGDLACDRAIAAGRALTIDQAAVLAHRAAPAPVALPKLAALAAV